MNNNIRIIKPIKIKGGSRLPIKGKELIDSLNSRIGILASTDSGKTTTLAHILKNTIDKRTTLIVFCPTVDIDDIWQHIISWCERKKIKVLTFHDVVNDETKENLVNFMLKKLENGEDITDDVNDTETKDEVVVPADVDGMSRSIFNSEKPTAELKKKKYVPPEVDRVPKYVWVFDDQPQEILRQSWLYNMLKKSRKLDSRVFIISQSIIDLKPSAKSQLSDLYLYPSFSRDYVEKVYKMLRTVIPFENFWNAFLEITKEPYSFMNIDLRKGTIRRNFDEPY